MATTVKVGDHVRCYDFSHTQDDFMEGVCFKVEDVGEGHTHIFMIATKLFHVGIELPVVGDVTWFCDAPHQSSWDVLFTKFERVVVLDPLPAEKVAELVERGNNVKPDQCPVGASFF